MCTSVYRTSYASPRADFCVCKASGLGLDLHSPRPGGAPELITPMGLDVSIKFNVTQANKTVIDVLCNFLWYTKKNEKSKKIITSYKTLIAESC